MYLYILFYLTVTSRQCRNTLQVFTNLKYMGLLAMSHSTKFERSCVIKSKYFLINDSFVVCSNLIT